MTATTKSTWAIDAAHSQVQFKIKHIAIANVNGTFDRFNGTVQSDGEDFDNATVHFEIETDSINTKHADRDKHLKSAHLFDAEQFPKMLFDGVLRKKGEAYTLAGSLTVRDTTKDITLEAELTGAGKGMFNDTRAGFEVNGKINRKDYGLTWNILTEAGSFVVGEEVKLQFDIELIKQENMR